MKSSFTFAASRRGGPLRDRAARHTQSGRRRRPRGTRIAVNFAPMIDVTFLLLIFFLVTTSFERAEGILAGKMPQESQAPGVPLPLSPIVVRLEQLGVGHDEFVIGLDRFDSVPSGFAELTEAVRQIHQLDGFDRKTPLVIIAEDDVRWDHVVGCWNAALRAGCERVAFGEP
ncbi:MAG: biopolymer transporter ExbD [Phycisphaerales bacterium]|nr:MAG: biopolymer transporter ExbD [Phycisphaerales bacterium]